MVSFPQAITMFFQRYVDFQGRSQRSEYWWVVLFNLIIFTLLFMFSGIGIEALEAEDYSNVSTPVLMLGVVYVLAILLPSIALVVRRFHDLNQTGWLYLAFIIVGILPFIGILASIAMYVWFAFPGTKGPNKYGPDPLGNTDEMGIFD